MMRAVNRWSAAALLGALGLFVLARPVAAAPGSKLVPAAPAAGHNYANLKDLFDDFQKQYPDYPVQDMTQAGGKPSFLIKVSNTVSIRFDEQDNGYARAWTEVVAFPTKPPLGMYAAMAKANDQSPWGFVSWGQFDQERKDGQGTGHVFLNFHLLIRSADAKAVADCIDSAVAQRDWFADQLKDYVPK